MRAYFQWVLAHRGLVLGAILTVTVLAALVFPRARVSSTLGDLFLGHSAEYADHRKRVLEFGSDEILVLAFEDADILSAASLQRLRRILDRLELIPEIDRAVSLLDLQEIWGSTDPAALDAALREMDRDPGRRQEILDDLLSDPLVGGILIAKDQKSAAVLITLDQRLELTAEAQVGVVERIFTAFADEGIPGTELRRAGAIVVVSDLMTLTKENLTRLFPIVCGVLVFAVWLLFRRLWPAFVSMAVALVAVTWTLAFGLLLNPNINIMMAAVPAVIVIISFSDVIHLSSAYLLELEHAPSKEEAILLAAIDVGRACVYTSLTTFVGFVCISLVPTPVFRHLGIVLGLGVGLALLLAMTLVPVLLSYLPTPSAWHDGAGRGVRSLLDRALGASRDISLRHPWPVIIVSALVLLAAFLGISRVRIETELSKRMDPESPLRQSLQYFEERYAGANVLDLWVDLAPGASLDDEIVFERLVECQRVIERTPHVDHVASIISLVEGVHRRLAETFDDLGAPFARRPLNAEDLGQYLTQMDLFAGDRLETILGSNRRTLRFVVRLGVNGLRESARIGDEIRAVASERLGDSGELHPSGMAYLMGKWLDEILRGQLHGVLVSFVTISILMTLALRSVRAGLISMIPNLLPILVLGGYVGLFWDVVDSDTILIGVLALGIGVDDTIHFLLRFRVETERAFAAETPHGSRSTTEIAIRRAYDFAGRGIVITTVILVLGFSPFATSNYFSLRILGTLLPLVLVVALVADLFLVPALATIGWLRPGRTRHSSGTMSPDRRING